MSDKKLFEVWLGWEQESDRSLIIEARTDSEAMKKIREMIQPEWLRFHHVEEYRPPRRKKGKPS